jgi:hypothetical protein
MEINEDEYFVSTDRPLYDYTWKRVPVVPFEDPLFVVGDCLYKDVLVAVEDAVRNNSEVSVFEWCKQELRYKKLADLVLKKEELV